MRRERRRHGGKNAGSANTRKMGVLGNRAGRLAAFALASIFSAASAAVAADFPVPVPIPPPIYVPPVYNWTGIYVGGNLGAGWSGLSAGNFSDTLGSSFAAGTNT